MVFQCALTQLEILPGTVLRLHDIAWQDFEQLLSDLGEHRGCRIVYYQGIVELMTPLPEHERIKKLLGSCIEIMLEIVEQDWESLGSTTFKREEMVAGAEPDDCYYIAHHAAVRGKQRLDLTVDPPPDLVIEVDITSSTRLQAYEALGVPELWRYADEQLTIFVLHGDHYNATERSPTFPHLPLVEELPRFIALSRTAGTRAMLRAFRNWVRGQHGGEETRP